MRIIISLVITAVLSSCSLAGDKTASYPPVFIGYANEIFKSETVGAVTEGEEVSYVGRKITRGDSTVLELEIAIKNAEKVPYQEELPELAKKIGTAVKTILADTNQYQQYKISYFRKNSKLESAGADATNIIILAKDVTSIPLNSSMFKPGLLKR
jgi:hypothetical protein